MYSTEQRKSIASGNGSPTNVTAETAKEVQSLLPHLESLERIIKLPVVGAAWDKSQDVYGKVKGNNRILNWALSAAEDCVYRAINSATSIVNRLDRPIQYVDQTLVKGIDKLEMSAPIIKETPQDIFHHARSKVIDVVLPHIDRVVKFKVAGQEKASSLKDLAWQKANEVLATQYGSFAINGVDSTTALAELLLEYYFPKSELDIEEDNVPVPVSEDPVLHTVQTVGRLSNKISRRVYRNVSRQIKRVQKGNINDYLSSLIAAMKLHQYINFINSSMGTNTEQSSFSENVVPTSASQSTAGNSDLKIQETNSAINTTSTNNRPTMPNTTMNKVPKSSAAAEASAPQQIKN